MSILFPCPFPAGTIKVTSRESRTNTVSISARVVWLYACTHLVRRVSPEPAFSACSSRGAGTLRHTTIIEQPATSCDAQSDPDKSCIRQDIEALASVSGAGMLGGGANTDASLMQ